MEKLNIGEVIPLGEDTTALVISIRDTLQRVII